MAKRLKIAKTLSDVRFVSAPVFFGFVPFPCAAADPTRGLRASWRGHRFFYDVLHSLSQKFKVSNRTNVQSDPSTIDVGGSN